MYYVVEAAKTMPLTMSQIIFLIFTFSALALFLSHSNKLPIVEDDNLGPKMIAIK